MSKIEQAKSYTGKELETVFFRPMLSGPDAQALGIRVMYNMPVPTSLHFWKPAEDILQKYTIKGWNGSAPSSKFQKTVPLSRVKAEVGYSAEDYFSMVYELMTSRLDLPLDDLSGTELEQAETALFKEAIAESIRATMWLGDTERDGSLNTFDGFLKQIVAALQTPDNGIATVIMEGDDDTQKAESTLKKLWDKSSRIMKDFKVQGNLVYLVTSDIYASYEDSLDSVTLDAAYLAKQEGRNGLMYRGIPVVDVQISGYLENYPEMPQSFALLTDRRNLALAVNTADFPGTEVKMWYNPDQMENRQRAVFMAGCDFLLPELMAIAFEGAEIEFDKSGMEPSGGTIAATVVSGSASAVKSIKATALNAQNNNASTEVVLTRNGNTFSATVSAISATKVRYTVTYITGETETVVK